MSTATLLAPAPRRRTWWPLGLGLAVLVLGWLIARGAAPYAFHGMVLQSGEASDFTLDGHHGQPVSLADFRGRVVLLFFGYASCPDVCPTTLATLARVREQLGARADGLQVLMVSVDPERDSAALLGPYVEHFDRSFLGLRGTPEQVSAVASRFGIFFERKNAASALGYLVDHTATVMAVDRRGHLKVVFPYGAAAGDIAADVSYLLEH